MIKAFDEFNSKFKFITNLDSDTDVAKELNIEYVSFASMKRNDRIPFDKVVEYCKDKCIDLNWIINIKKNS